MTADVGEAILGRIHEFRAAARLATQADAPFRDRCLAILDLVDHARREPDLVVRTWSERAIWREIAPFLGVVDDALALPMSFEAAQRKLRAQGLEECPVCRCSVASEDDLARWARMRRDDAYRRDVQRRAVER